MTILMTHLYPCLLSGSLVLATLEAAEDVQVQDVNRQRVRWKGEKMAPAPVCFGVKWFCTELLQGLQRKQKHLGCTQALPQERSRNKTRGLFGASEEECCLFFFAVLPVCLLHCITRKFHSHSTVNGCFFSSSSSLLPFCCLPSIWLKPPSSTPTRVLMVDLGLRSLQGHSLFWQCKNRDHTSNHYIFYLLLFFDLIARTRSRRLNTDEASDPLTKRALRACWLLSLGDLSGRRGVRVMSLTYPSS